MLSRICQETEQHPKSPKKSSSSNTSSSSSAAAADNDNEDNKKSDQGNENFPFDAVLRALPLHPHSFVYASTLLKLREQYAALMASDRFNNEFIGGSACADNCSRLIEFSRQQMARAHIPLAARADYYSPELIGARLQESLNASSPVPLQIWVFDHQPQRKHPSARPVWKGPDPMHPARVASGRAGIDNNTAHLIILRQRVKLPMVACEEGEQQEQHETFQYWPCKSIAKLFARRHYCFECLSSFVNAERHNQHCPRKCNMCQIWGHGPCPNDNGGGRGNGGAGIRCPGPCGRLFASRWCFLRHRERRPWASQSVCERIAECQHCGAVFRRQNGHGCTASRARRRLQFDQQAKAAAAAAADEGPPTHGRTPTPPALISTIQEAMEEQTLAEN